MRDVWRKRTLVIWNEERVIRVVTEVGRGGFALVQLAITAGGDSQMRKHQR